MNDRLASLRLFVRVARRGSFSAGGRQLNIPQPTVSRMISGLERELGVVLFTRTTRAVTLTEAGTDFLERIEPILAALDEAEYAVRGTGELRGVLRVGISTTFAVREIVPRLPRFMEQHPALRIELLADDQRQDFVSEGIDVGLRLGLLAELDCRGTQDRDMEAAARRFAQLSREGGLARKSCRPCGTFRHRRSIAAWPGMDFQPRRQGHVRQGRRPADGDRERSRDGIRRRRPWSRLHGKHWLPTGAGGRLTRPGPGRLGHGLDRLACDLSRRKGRKTIRQIIYDIPGS